MADWSRAKLGDVQQDTSGQWWALVRVPVDGPDDDPRRGPVAAAPPPPKKRKPRGGL